MKRVFSGIQPSGAIHIGNYIGAMKRWVDLQDDYECYYSVVDLHAITVPQDPKELAHNIEDAATYFLASGLNPDKVVLFAQSDVPCHAEASWIMECTATFGELSRMTQFKDKTEGKESFSAGLFTYPALQAADIVLYDADFVPVGEDQRQHVEITRDLAIRFNGRFGPVLKVPELMIGESGARIKSLQDPSRKMSKSDPNPFGYISLADSRDEISRKIKRAVTDSGREVIFDPEEKPALANLITIYSACSGESIEHVAAKYAGKGYADFKKDLTDVVVAMIDPVQQRYRDIKASGDVRGILTDGARKANKVASHTLKRMKEAMGLSTAVDPAERVI